MSYYEENRQSSQYNLQVSDNWREGQRICFYVGCWEDWSL